MCSPIFHNFSPSIHWSSSTFHPIFIRFCPIKPRCLWSHQASNAWKNGPPKRPATPRLAPAPVPVPAPVPAKQGGSGNGWHWGLFRVIFDSKNGTKELAGWYGWATWSPSASLNWPRWSRWRWRETKRDFGESNIEGTCWFVLSCWGSLSPMGFHEGLVGDFQNICMIERWTLMKKWWHLFMVWRYDTADVCTHGYE